MTTLQQDIPTYVTNSQNSSDPDLLKALCHQEIERISQCRYSVKLLAIALRSLQQTAGYKQGRNR